MKYLGVFALTCLVSMVSAVVIEEEYYEANHKPIEDVPGAARGEFEFPTYCGIDELFPITKEFLDLSKRPGVISVPIFTAISVNVGAITDAVINAFFAHPVVVEHITSHYSTYESLYKR